MIFISEYNVSHFENKVFEFKLPILCLIFLYFSSVCCSKLVYVSKLSQKVHFHNVSHFTNTDPIYFWVLFTTLIIVDVMRKMLMEIKTQSRILCFSIS